MIRPGFTGVHRLAASVAANFVLVLCLGMGACSHPDDDLETVHGIAQSLLSDPVRDLVAWQSQVLATDPATPAAGDVRLYYRLRQDLRIPARNQAAADTLWQRWSAEPTHLLWIEAAMLRARELGDFARLDTMLATAAAADSTGPVAIYIDTRRGWSRDPEAQQRFLATSERADELDPLSRLWLELRLALVENLRGENDLARRRLERTLPAAWQVGGPSLAACWWYDLSGTNRKLGRLDDALASAFVAIDCARRGKDAIQEIRGHLALARAHLARGDYGEATAVAEVCTRLATDGAHQRWIQDATRLLAEVNRARGDRRAALVQQRRSLDLALAMADTQAAVAATLILASTHRYLGEIDSTEVWLARAEHLDRAGTPQNLDHRIAAVRLSLALQVGDFARADSLRRIVAHRLPGPGRRQIALDLMEQGLETGRPDLSYRGLEETRRDASILAREGSYDPVVDVAHLSARLHARQGEFQRAAGELATASARIAEGATEHARWDHADCAGRIAELAGDLETAATSYTQALAIATELADPNLINRSRIHLGEVLIRRDRLDQARNLFAGSADVPEYWTRLAGTLLLGCVEAADGDHAAALDRFAAADLLLRPDAPRDLRARLRLEQARSLIMVGRPRDALASLDRVDLSPGAGASVISSEEYRAFHRPLHREIAELRIGLLADQPELAGGVDPALATLAVAEAARWRVDPTGPEPDVDTLRRLQIAAGSPVAAYFVGRNRVFGWCGTDQGWTLFEIADRSRLLQLVQAVQTDMESPERPVSWTDARELARLLLDPVLPHWQPDRPLQLVATGPLADLPWPALPLADVAPASSLVVDHGPVVHLAGLAATGSVVRSGSALAGTLLAVGVNTSGTARRLHQPEAEARAVAALWPAAAATVLTGEAGSWSNLRAQGLAGFSVIHVASHAVVSEGLPGCSTLRLAGPDDDQPVTIPEVRSLDLAADLVYLSCCDGGRLARDTGTGLDSFARAFLQAGAGAVVASTRQVDDDAALALALRFYGCRAHDTSWATCLQAAQLGVREDRSPWRHPFYWGFYQLHQSGPAGN